MRWCVVGFIISLFRDVVELREGSGCEEALISRSSSPGLQVQAGTEEEDPLCLVEKHPAAVPDADLKKEKATSDLVKRSDRCGHGWSQFNNRCFRYISGAQTWPRAERNCRSMGATLASVHDVHEYHEIQRLVLTATHSYQQAWIGGCDIHEDGHWMWSDGSAFGYADWCPGEPNNGRGRKQDCLQMNFSSAKCWDDLQCQYKLPYVCVKKI
ncbi:hypothetical protein OJAV_G00184860 [Oryzias javanicus]|uniref:C-type lectin domain-containing protein n=1 Tax=Oryzias javanicus TaxID=123683 RepID=A0A437CDB6_ORYJA|nr:hypothetical protein OJAV_G00184860 [Oryzias javanicus]